MCLSFVRVIYVYCVPIVKFHLFHMNVCVHNVIVAVLFSVVAAAAVPKFMHIELINEKLRLYR